MLPLAKFALEAHAPRNLESRETHRSICLPDFPARWQATVRVLLAKPAELTQYDGLKHADDQSDAFFLAELLGLGILPTGYVCERKLRAVRDLLRRRAGLVAKRTALILSLRNLQLRTKGYALDSSLLKSGSAHDLVSQFEDPAEKLTADVQKTHIDGFTRSILRIEDHVLKIANKRPHYRQLLSLPGIGKSWP